MLSTVVSTTDSSRRHDLRQLWQRKRFVEHGSVQADQQRIFLGSGDGDYAVNARLTHLLWYEDDGRQLFHIGISGRQASAVSQAGVAGRFQTFRTRDAIRSGLSAGWPVQQASRCSVTIPSGRTLKWLE